MSKASCIFAIAAALSVGPVVAAQTCNDKAEETTPSSRFKDNGDGTVTDTKTRLVWRHCAVGMEWNGSGCEKQSQTFKYSEAKAVIDELNKTKDGNRSDWRLPTRDELTSLVEERCYAPAMNLDVFSFSPESAFWTADLDEGQVSSRAWVIHFLNGKPYIANTRQAWRVRPVAGKK